jgi:hypothetical protein
MQRRGGVGALIGVVTFTLLAAVALGDSPANSRSAGESPLTPRPLAPGIKDERAPVRLRHRTRLLAVACILLVAASCSRTPTGAGSTNTATTQMATGTSSEVSSTRATAEEALCSGVQYGLAESGGEITSPTFHELWDSYGREECMAEASDALLEIKAASGSDASPRTAEGWFEVGCYQSAYAWGLELTGDQGMSDAMALRVCATPFQIATDLNVDWELTATGVCFQLDFSPTDEQIAGGLIACDSRE